MPVPAGDADAEASRSAAAGAAQPAGAPGAGRHRRAPARSCCWTSAARRRPVGLVGGGSGADTPLLGRSVLPATAPWPRPRELRDGDVAALLARQLSVLVLPTARWTPGEAARWPTGSAGRPAAPLRRPGPRLRRGYRSAAAGTAAGRRPAARRRDVLEPARASGAVPGRLALRRPAHAGGGAGEPPGAGRPVRDLPHRDLGRLADGTPLVTAARVGAGGWCCST